MAPKRHTHLTIELATERMNFYKLAVEVLTNHIEVLENDSYETVIFKLYANLQSVRKVSSELPNYGFKKVSDTNIITAILEKETIPDKSLETFVKKIQRSNKKNMPS